MKKIWYITYWKDGEVWDNIYKDTGFTNKIKAVEYCDQLNKNAEDNEEYEVYTLDLDMFR